MSRLSRIAVIGLLAMLSAIVAAETPDECAARLDQSIAIRTYDEAADWWARVERECAPQPEIASTPEPTEIPGYQGIYGWEGDLVFCVMSPALNVRSSAGGPVVGRFDKGTLFTVDLASQELVDGFVWGKHDKGWSALFRYPGTDGIDEFTYPQACPVPTATPSPIPRRRATPTPARLTTSTQRTTSPRGAAGQRYDRDSTYRASMDRLIKGYSETYARSLCGVIDGNRNCSDFPGYAAVTNCILRTAFFESDDFEEAAAKAENFIGRSIPKMLQVAAFVYSGGLDKNYANLSRAEKNLVDNLSLMEQCFYQIEA